MSLRKDWATSTNELFSSKLLQRLASIPADLSLSVSCLSSVEQQILYPYYQAFLQRHERYLPTLESQDLAIVRDLELKGIAVTSIDRLNLPDTDNFFAAAKQISDELARMSRTNEYRGKHTFSATAVQLMQYPDVFWWGVQERLLRIVECYLKLPVAYDGLSYYYSIANSQESGPRKWHRDKEDWRMIKIGVYLNDVDDLGGPFECVFPEANAKIHEFAKQPYQIFPESELKNLLGDKPETWRKSCTGVTGTVIFVDTAAYYHRGRPPISINRSAIFFSYFSRRPKHPFFCGRSPLSQQQLAELARPLSSHLQESILWRNNLPGIGRWIPKNRLKV
jgi:hypothetical protein